MKTLKQKRFIEDLELRLAKLVYNNEKALANKVGPIVESLLDGYYDLAVKLANVVGMPKWYVSKMRRIFKV